MIMKDLFLILCLRVFFQDIISRPKVSSPFLGNTDETSIFAGVKKNHT